MGRIAPLPERLWRRTERTASGCLLWLGATNGVGYGRIFVSSETGALTYTHRLAYELTFGPIPDGLQVCHRCDVPACCEPSHLFLGTNADNSADKVRKGRQARGAALPQTKYSDEQVRDIRAACAAGERQVDVAHRFGVRPGYVCRVVSGSRRLSVTA